MYGSYSAVTYVGIALGVMLVISLFIWAAPLFAILISVLLAVPALGIMVFQRRRSEESLETDRTREREASAETRSRQPGSTSGAPPAA